MSEMAREIAIRRLAAEYGPFAEMVRETSAALRGELMPENLRPWDRTITRDEVNNEARAVFVIWLASQLDRTRSAAQDRLTAGATTLPCQDSHLMESFFPEWFSDGSGNTDIADEAHLESQIYLIDVALAKRACSDCPLRLECLARSLHADGVIPDEVDETGTQRWEPFGVWGGRGPRARGAIHNKYLELRKSWRRAEFEALNELEPASVGGMSIADRIQFLTVAAEIVGRIRGDGSQGTPEA